MPDGIYEEKLVDITKLRLPDDAHCEGFLKLLGGLFILLLTIKIWKNLLRLST